MKMKTRSKALLTAACALLLVVATVFGTFAYLTSTTGTVTNTFTVGNVNITLDETKTDENGVAVTPAARTTEGNAYKLIPGKTYIKDPTVTVKAGSEQCWLFVKVESANWPDTVTYTSNLTEANGWTDVTNTCEVTGCKLYVRIADASASTTDLTFALISGGTITASGDMTSAQAAEIAANAPKLEYTAYAVQAEGIDTALEAWTVLNPSSAS